MSKGSVNLSGGNIRIKSTEQLAKGFLKTERVTFQHTRFNGQESRDVVRERIVRGDAVHILLVDTENELICLTKQIRPCVLDTDKPFMLEAVAGMIDKGESPVEAAIREAKEEVGVEVIPDNVHVFGSPVFTAPGSLTERTTLMVGFTDLANVQEFGGMDDENEDIQVVVYDLNTFGDLITEGVVRDLPTICVWQHYCLWNTKMSYQNDSSNT